MSGGSIWTTLGISQTRDRTAIRRAYAARLKVAHPEDDPEGFQALRAAYERALAMAARPAALDWLAYDHGDDEEEETAPEPQVQIAEVQIAEVPVAEVARVEPDPVPERAPEPPPQVVLQAPSPVRSPERLHEDAMRRLEGLVLAAGTPSPGELTQALDAVLRSQAMEQLGVYVRTETWLAALIARHLPRTDPMLIPALERFGWTVSERDRRVDPHVAAIVARTADIRRLDAYRRKGHSLRGSMKLLEAPPNRHSIWIAALIPGRLHNLRELLRKLDATQRGGVIDFPEGSVEGWRAVLEQPRIPAAAVWLVLGFAPFLAWFVDAMSAPRVANGLTQNTVAFFLWWPALTAAGFGLLALNLYLIDLPRYLWRTRWAERSGPWLSLGWVRTGLSLIVMSLILPAEPWSVGGVAVFGAALVLWASATGDRFAASKTLYPWPIRWLGRNAPLALMWGSRLARVGDPYGAQIAVAVAACALATCLGEATLARLWLERLTPQIRRRTLIAACAVSGGLLVTVLYAADTAIVSVLAAAVSVMALLQRAPAALAPALRPRLPLARHPRAMFFSGVVALVCLNSLRGEAVVYAAWLVCGGTLTGFIMALRREWEARPTKPGKVFS